MDKYWKSIEEKRSGIEEKDVPMQNKSAILDILENKEPNLTATRRDFLKLFGFSVGVAAVAASCEQPVQKAIPYLIKPENITPGKASYFASSYFEDNQYCSILVKVRDGRPIKIEGNELSEISGGGTTARVQASMLSLYDTHRFKAPQADGQETTWEEIDRQITDELKKIKKNNKKLVILSSTIISPSTLAVIENFKKQVPNCDVVVYDAISSSAILSANKLSFNRAVIPSYHFDKAMLIVNFGADFLGTWINPVTFAKAYSKNRDLTNNQKKISKHIQFESNMSLTGSNADKRILIKPSEEKLILAAIYNELAKNTGASVYNNIPDCDYDLSETVSELLNHRGESIVLSGSNDTEIQLIVNAINYLLGNYSKTIDITTPVNIKKGIDADLTALKNEIETGKIGGLIIYNANPVYHIPGFENLLKKIELTISFSTKPDETISHVKYVCPDHTYLESWNDFEPVKGYYSLSQPVISPIFKTRQAQESILRWTGIESSYYEFIKENWSEQVYPEVTTNPTFKEFWNKTLQDGCVTIKKSKLHEAEYKSDPVIKVFQTITKPATKEIELTLYEKTAIGSGELANIPWLQEMPDPVTKATWDNYLTISPKYAMEQNLKTGELVKINDSILLPVYIQPGQTYGTAGIALGYGRSNAGLVATGTGVNVYPLVDFTGEERKYVTSIKSIEKTGEFKTMAITQTHHSMEGRDIIRETTLDEYLEKPDAGNERHKEVEKQHVSLYKQKEFPGHHWGMAIDLNKCTGCGACVIACQVENNIPVVGRTEVSRVHEMHWIRIDRYYNGSEDNPETVRQPVMCQHCDNAPCENVCPVAATNHSSEGLNQMVYNRCIGTRYCNNNCPYKVRRFNYFDYNGADAIKGNEHDLVGLSLDLPRMVLNPDVTIRAKGVIEKCSFCVQRIQDKKLQAKLENRELKDGEIKPACAQSCPSDAIIFGDLNDPESKVSKYYKDERNYHLLEELHTLPSVGYLTKVKNTDPSSKNDLTEKVNHEG